MTNDLPSLKDLRDMPHETAVTASWLIVNHLNACPVCKKKADEITIHAQADFDRRRGVLKA